MKFSWKFFYLAFFFMLVANISYADTTLSNLSTRLNAMHTLQADFTQTVYDNRGKVIQTSYGHMALQRPGRFRWQIVKPIPQLIIANASRIWIYDPDLEQVTLRSLKNVAGETPALLLSHVNNALEDDFTVSTKPNTSSTTEQFLLTPKKADNMFSSIELDFTNKKLSTMRLKDQLGHATLIQFKNAKDNVNLPATFFNFKPPANTDVIDETHKEK